MKHHPLGEYTANLQKSLKITSTQILFQAQNKPCMYKT